jgi:ribosomal protein S18 acetylase RimI-like enzyme
MNENNAKEIIIIRPLRKADLPALEWEGEYLHFRRVFQDVYQRIEKGMVKCWVALTQDNQMIGQVFLQLVSDRKELADGWKRAYLYSLRVKPAWRNRGIGS